jgi:hypothetical protein
MKPIVDNARVVEVLRDSEGINRAICTLDESNKRKVKTAPGNVIG